MRNRDIIKILVNNGFNFIRANKHEIYSNGKVSVAVPHGHECTKGLVRRIFTQAGFNKQFIQEIL